MAENKYNSKVVLANGEVLFDLTQDDVTPEDVASGIKFHDKTGAPKTGTNKKTVDASNATATAAEVLAGKTFGKGNEMATGTMPDNSGKDVEITTTGGTTIPKGFTDGASKAKLAASELEKLIPGNIKAGVTLLGVHGDYGPDDMSSQHKEVTPSFTEQEIQPDNGISFLSGVTVKAIHITRTDNEAGGVTVTIG